MAEYNESLQELLSKVPTEIAELREWRKLATVTAKNLKVAETDVVLEFGFLQAAQDELDVQTVEVAELQEPLVAKTVDLL